METNKPAPIICGTDFSENAKQAATAAAVLAARLGKPLLLVHIADRSFRVEDDLLQKQLQDEADRLKPFGAPVEIKVLAGRLANQELIELGKERAASLIVVSSVSKTAFARWTMGSVSEYLTQVNPVPTLVVRNAAPFEAWASNQRPLKVFIGADFTATSEAALRWVADLRQFGPLDIIAGYVTWPPEEAARLDTSEELKLGEDSPVMQRLIERDLLEKVTRLLGDENVSVRSVGSMGRPDMPLVEMAIEAQADLIVVGTHQRSGLTRLQHGSVSRGIVRHAPMSVVCVPTSAMTPVVEPHIRECHRVLVAIDPSDPHDFVIPYAYSIIQAGGAVRLVHNIRPIPLPLSDPMTAGYAQPLPKPEDQAQLVAGMTSQLLALVPNEAEKRGITTEVEITEKQDTARAICAAAERFDADIICIGGHTRPGPLAKALGSVSLAVLQSSRRPVLVVWPPAG